MTPAIIAAVVLEIEQYAGGKRDGRLSWAALEEFSGFSSVSLWLKEDIKLAFRRAKLSTPKASKPKKPEKTTDEKILQLNRVVDEQRSVIANFDKLWALYEANVQRLGLDPEELRRPLDPTDRVRVRSRGGQKRRR